MPPPPDSRRARVTPPRRIFLVTRFVVILAVLLALGAYILFVRPNYPSEPQLTGSAQRGTVHVGDRDRSFVYYAPARLPSHPPLLIALHGAGHTGERFRAIMGYDFDRLADASGFVVVYPDAYGGHWNDCRRVATFAARTENIDDRGFVHALIDRFRTTHHVDVARVYAMGHSNGGSMAYRLALEMPEEIRAIAAVSAALRVPNDSICVPSGIPISVLVMNGTSDPIDPYEGGTVSLFGLDDRGRVRSSRDTVAYFAGLARLTSDPSVERLPSTDASLWVERTMWRAPQSVEVVLDTVHGGGHVVPQPFNRYPRILGRTDAEFDGPAEIWSFFARQHAP